MPAKVAASTALFAVVLVAVGLLASLLSGPDLWSEIDRAFTIGPLSTSLSGVFHLLLGFSLLSLVLYFTNGVLEEKGMLIRISYFW